MAREVLGSLRPTAHGHAKFPDPGQCEGKSSQKIWLSHLPPKCRPASHAVAFSQLLLVLKPVLVV